MSNPLLWPSGVLGVAVLPLLTACLFDSSSLQTASEDLPVAAETAVPVSVGEKATAQPFVGRLPPKDLAYKLVVMVNARATRPPDEEDEEEDDDWVFEIEDDVCSDVSGQTGRFGAGIISARVDGAVYVVTPEHVAFPCHWPPSRVTVEFHFLQGRTFVAEALQQRDPEMDLAVLKVTETADLTEALDGLKFERTRSPRALRQGDGVQTIGNPGGNAWYLNPFGLDRFDRLDDWELGFHARMLTKGNSGGALFTEDWYLVGMVQSELLPFGKALAIDEIIEQVEAWGLPVGLQMPPAPPKVAEVLRDCEVCPEMLALPAGRFEMGVEPHQDDFRPDEKPRHTVDIAEPFLLGRYEVSVAEFRAFVESTSYQQSGGCKVWSKGNREWQENRDKGWDDPGFPIGTENRPVVCVSWKDATAYTVWLSRVTGQRYRLPTEAEWEYAARAGTQTFFWWGDHLPANRAACTDCRSAWDIDRPAPVGSFEPNFFGLHDMNGNVWEWVEDCRHKNYEGAPSDGRAWNDGGDCSKRIRRGGSILNDGSSLRSANRHQENANKRTSSIGFRVARDAGVARTAVKGAEK